MTENNFKKQARQVLQSTEFGYDVKTSKKYHGIDVDMIATHKSSGKTVFLYVADKREADPLDVISLYTLRKGNHDLEKYNCRYFLLSKDYPGETVEDLSRASNIPILRNIDDLKKKLSDNSSSEST